MSELIKTLHKKGDANIEIYPNIKAENIPAGAITFDKIANYAVIDTKIALQGVANGNIRDGAISTIKIENTAVTTDKISDSAVTTNKIVDDAVTTSKINDLAVTTDKINNYAITTDKINNGAVTLQKLADDIVNTLLRLQYCYNLYIGDSDDKIFTFYRSTTLSNIINDYSTSDISHALDFDKATASDYTNSDLAILKIIIDGFNEDITSNYINGITINNYLFQMIHISGYYNIHLSDNGVTLFELKFDETTLNIINYVNTKYVYIELSRLINPNITYE